ncbi:hypothetical protein LOD99_16035 [Oopsacas minuta]|uniref:BZIP domain-containing protein n=1 Tax=Oopsacas minuta TaxID=111878 RepID=A0AAV7K6U2_9METZ|nr:hypothetical protein LOD99_16035 [Oopsacas minuta]
MNIFNLLKDGAKNYLHKQPIESLIDDGKLGKIDGRRKLPRILKNSNITEAEKELVYKRKKRINQQNALKAFRQRERVSFRRLECEISRKKQEKLKLEKEIKELTKEIQQLANMIN